MVTTNHNKDLMSVFSSEQQKILSFQNYLKLIIYKFIHVTVLQKLLNSSAEKFSVNYYY